MTTTHTPGRLQVPEPYDGQYGVIVENDSGRYAVAVSIRNPADARRLAACWNACDGIPTEALERTKDDTTPVFELLMQTTKQRDALRTALNNLLNTVNQYDDGDYYLGTDAEQILAEANRVSIETAEPAPPDTTTPPCPQDTQPPSPTAPSPVCANFAPACPHKNPCNCLAFLDYNKIVEV